MCNPDPTPPGGTLRVVSSSAPAAPTASAADLAQRISDLQEIVSELNQALSDLADQLKSMNPNP